MSFNRQDVKVEAYIHRTQFTRYDREDLHPECDNGEYLEYETIKDHLTGEDMTISYGYQICVPNTSIKDKRQGNYYWWIQKEIALAIIKKQEGK